MADRYYSHETTPLIPARLGRLPSVTTITDCYPKPWLYPWMKKVGMEGAEKTKQDSLDIGTRVHFLIEEWAKKRTLDFSNDPQPVKWAFDAFLKWAKQVEFNPVDTEQVVYSEHYKYAGRLDITGWVEGEFALVDAKTSKDLYPEHVIQESAYWKAYEECRPRLYGATTKPLRKLIILQLGKTDGAFLPHDVTRYSQKAFEEFLRLRETWEFNQTWTRHRKSLEVILPEISFTPPKLTWGTGRPFVPKTTDARMRLVIERMESVKMLLACYLSEAFVGETNAQAWVIHVPHYPLHQTVLELRENKQLVEKIVSEVAGQPMRVTFQDGVDRESPVAS